MPEPRVFRRGPRALADRLLVARVFAVAAAVPFLVRLGPSRLAWLMERVPVARVPDPAAADRVRDALDRVIRSGRPFVRPGCLTRGLTLYLFLRRAGIDVALSFGIGRPDARFAGHCWLVRDGEPFLERRDPRGVFAEMYSIPRRTGAVP